MTIRALDWRADKKGLAVVSLSLLMIACISILIYSYIYEQREALIRSHGTSLVKILSAMPIDKFVSDVSSNNPLINTIQNSLTDDNFAYITLVSPDGKQLTGKASQGVTIPRLHIPLEPAFWFGERSLTLDNSDADIMEFHAPLLQDGQLHSFIRLGFFLPGFERIMPQLPFFATLAFLIFNLGCVIYFITRIDRGQLTKLNDHIDSLIQKNNTGTLQIEASGELFEFISRFNVFLDRASEKQKNQEVINHELMLQSKLETYKSSRMNSILQTLPDAVFVLDDTGRLSFSNSKLKYYLGLKGPLTEGQTLAEWCPHKEIIGFLSRGEGMLQESAKQSHITLKVASNSERIIHFNRYPLFSPNNPDKTYGTLVIGRDITQQNMALMQRGEFIAQVAHELKNPLNVLSMYSEALLGEDGNSTDFRIEACNVIHDEVERLSTLISNLLNLSKLESGSIQPERHHVRVHDLLKDTFDTITTRSRKKNLEFEFSIPNEITPVYLDKDLIRIAVSNLMTNAIKYNQEGGKVFLKGQETESSIIISVEDTGIGISEEECAHVFDKYFRSSSDEVCQQPGHGLGLSLTKEIVELLHGTISVQSVLGKGSKFSIQFDKTIGLLQRMAK